MRKINHQPKGKGCPGVERSLEVCLRERLWTNVGTIEGSVGWASGAITGTENQEPQEAKTKVTSK